MFCILNGCGGSGSSVSPTKATTAPITLAKVAPAPIAMAKAVPAKPVAAVAPAGLADCVAIGFPGGVLVDPTHALCTWHAKRNGVMRWPDGETARVIAWTQIGTSDICVLKLDHAIAVNPAEICDASKGWFRNQFGKFLTAGPSRNGGAMRWPGCGLINLDSGSPLLVDLGGGKAGVCALATGYTVGPALWFYKSQIGKAMQ